MSEVIRSLIRTIDSKSPKNPHKGNNEGSNTLLSDDESDQESERAKAKAEEKVEKEEADSDSEYCEPQNISLGIPSHVKRN